MKRNRDAPKRKDIIFYALEYVPAPASILQVAGDADTVSVPDSSQSIIQHMETLQSGEHAWVQILLQATRVRGKSELYFDAEVRGLYIADRAHGRTAYMRESASALPNFTAGPITSEIMYSRLDVAGIRKTFRSATLYNAYVRRNYFYPPHRRKSFLLTQEEIRRLYTFAPQKTVSAPPSAMERVSRKLEPPANLPI